MKLLIITQKVDINDDILGFFHNWIEEFTKHCEKVTVICLQKGEYNLSKNVKVLSLGKEERVSKFKYLWKFYKYIWQERKNYDLVFVHMNPEYLVLAGIFWKISRKKIFFWYNHKKGGWKTKLAFIFPKKIFHTSKQAFSSAYSKAMIMPAGTDISMFKSHGKIERNKKSILSLGRISPVKKLEFLIDALDIINKNGVDFLCNIYGDASEKDEEYYLRLKNMAHELEKVGRIIFHKGLSHHKTPEIYNQNEIFINLTPSGSFDKTIIEAVACGCLPIVCNQSFRGVFEDIFLFEAENSLDLSKKIVTIMNLDENKKNDYRKAMIHFTQNHGLDILIDKLIYVFKE